jgi:hypothetical protein
MHSTLTERETHHNYLSPGNNPTATVYALEKIRLNNLIDRAPRKM